MNKTRQAPNWPFLPFLPLSAGSYYIKQMQSPTPHHKHKQNKITVVSIPKSRTGRKCPQQTRLKQNWHARVEWRRSLYRHNNKPIWMLRFQANPMRITRQNCRRRDSSHSSECNHVKGNTAVQGP